MLSLMKPDVIKRYVYKIYLTGLITYLRNENQNILCNDLKIDDIHKQDYMNIILDHIQHIGYALCAYTILDFPMQ
jgi:hypothetical protein